VDGGANNLLYHAKRSGRDLAVKFTIRDERRRAWREFSALQILRAAGLELAPQPLGLDEDRRQPVVVQSWLGGTQAAAPPGTDAEWESLAEYYRRVHRIICNSREYDLREAVFHFWDCEEGKRKVYEHAARIPPDQHPLSLRKLLAALADWPAPGWDQPSAVLCRADPNYRNFLRGGGGYVSVDWENSGWGDAAFEIADLLVHPSYEDVPQEQLERFAHCYAAQSGDPGLLARVWADRTVLLAWWAVRFARYIYEIPRGLDPRLAQPQPGWLDGMQLKYERALDKAHAHLTKNRAG